MTRHDLARDVLFVGVTRPAMRWGVTYSALVVNAFIALELFLITRNLLTLAIAAPIHGLFVLLCARDARIFELALLAARTRGPHLLGNLRHWGGASYSPLPVSVASVHGRRRARRAPLVVVPPRGGA